MVKAVKFSGPAIDGTLDITLTLYPVPDEGLVGMVALISPEVTGPSSGRVPITVGDKKEPEASDNSAVNVFDGPNEPVDVKEIVTGSPAQNKLPGSSVESIVCPNPGIDMKLAKNATNSTVKNLITSRSITAIQRTKK